MRIGWLHQNRVKKMYRYDEQDSIEIAHLLQSEYMVMGGLEHLFPAKADFRHVRHILDIGCGPGGWTLEVARTYPHIHVTGIDEDRLMVDYARVQGWLKSITNVDFQEASFQQRLNFPDDHFDVVSSRLMMGYFSRNQWPAFIQECSRIIRPGGNIQLIESEISITNSNACECLNGLLARMLDLSGHSFSPDGRHFGVIPQVKRFLHKANYQNVQNSASIIDVSAQRALHDEFYQDFISTFDAIEPFIIELGLSTQEEFHALYTQAKIDMHTENFCGFWLLSSFWASKVVDTRRRDTRTLRDILLGKVGWQLNR